MIRHGEVGASVGHRGLIFQDRDGDRVAVGDTGLVGQRQVNDMDTDSQRQSWGWTVANRASGIGPLVGQRRVAAGIVRCRSIERDGFGSIAILVGDRCVRPGDRDGCLVGQNRHDDAVAGRCASGVGHGKGEVVGADAQRGIDGRAAAN